LGNMFALGINFRYIYSNLGKGATQLSEPIKAGHAFGADLSGTFNKNLELGKNKMKTNIMAGFNMSNMGTKISAEVVVIAGGLGCFEPRKPEVKDLEKFENGKGVSYMVLDPESYRGKKIVITGSGPAGFFAAFFLQKAGFTTTLLERGKDVASRATGIENFEKTGVFDPQANYAFGEGGAGTFSDGKLTSRSKHISAERQFILNEYICNSIGVIFIAENIYVSGVNFEG